jgi:outer membrane protein OmpA-like peptidoglycan-associated protein
MIFNAPNRFRPLFAAGVLSWLLAGCAISAKQAPVGADAVAQPAPIAEAGPVDSDGDGVFDDSDACPGTRAGAEVDHKGCEILGRVENAHFAFDSATLTGEAMAMLDALAQRLNALPGGRFEVAGHTDSMGSEGYNDRLGQRRAISVVEYLDRRGVAADRLVLRSYGESRPVASNDTEQGMAMNRRVEIVQVGD